MTGQDNIFLYRMEQLDAAKIDLTASEDRWLRGNRFSREREKEWRLGRTGVKLALGALGLPLSGVSILNREDGAPYLEGCPANVSISHEGEMLAVIVGTAADRIGIDVCLSRQRGRLGAIVRRFANCDSALDPIVVWAAVESALKARRRPVSCLMDDLILLKKQGDVLVVEGLGAPCAVHSRVCEEYAVGWCKETATCIS